MSDLEVLLKKTRYSKYKNSNEDPKKVLEWIFNEIAHRKYDWRAEWDILVELIADKLRPRELAASKKYFPPDGISFLPETKHKDLAEEFSEELDHYLIVAQKDPWDHLGMIREEQIGFNKQFLGQVLTPKNVVEAMTRMCYESAEKTWVKPKTQLDPCVGTGRFLIYPSILFPDYKKNPLLLFGVEIDLSLYRACIVNLSLFSKHPFSIVCADTLMLDPNLTGCNSPIWILAGNRWDPPWELIKKFYWKPPPPPPITSKKFSLSYYTSTLSMLSTKKTD